MATSQRALLGLAAAATATAALKPGTAQAADGDNLKLGIENQADTVTTLRSERNGGLAVYSTVDDGAVAGINTAADGYGLRGTGSYIGVDAIGGQIGLLADSEGIAVQAETLAGTAVKAMAGAPTAWALDVSGPVKFTTAGRARVAAKQIKVVVSGLALKPTSMVLATLQGHVAGLRVDGVVINAAAGTATIWLSKAAPSAVDVGWFVIG